MSNHASVDLDLVVANMPCLTADEAGYTATDDLHVTTPTTTDLEPYAQGKSNMVTDTKATSIDNEPSDATGAARCSNKTGSSTSSKNSSICVSPDIPGTPDTQAACTTIQSSAPVPVVYPPRRPNIFKTRQKHIHFPVSGLSAVARRPVHVGTTTEELEAADGFSTADLEEFQADIKDRMQKKWEMFMKMVRQNSWKGRRVEDLGEVFAIED